MIAMLLLAALPAQAADHRGTVAVAPSVVAVRTASRHRIRPGLDVAVTRQAPWWSATAEVGGTVLRDGQAWYGYTTVFLRASVVAGIALPWEADRPWRPVFHLGLGPALTMRAGSLTWDDERRGYAVLEPGVRLRSALGGGLGRSRRVGWTLHVGATTRGVRETDFDVGLGVAWTAW